MTRKKTRWPLWAVALCAPLLLAGCGIYSFVGTSIQPDVRTISIPLAEYTALQVNPTLSAQLTDALQEKFRKLTRLDQVDEGADLDLQCQISGYSVRATAISADEQAAMNRLSVSVKVVFTNHKYPEDNVERSFSAEADFPADQSLDLVESSLCEEIVEKLVEDIFNATVAQW